MSGKGQVVVVEVDMENDKKPTPTFLDLDANIEGKLRDAKELCFPRPQGMELDVNKEVDKMAIMEFAKKNVIVPKTVYSHVGSGKPLMVLPGPNDKEENEIADEKGVRFCAYCTIYIHAVEVKFCSKCNKRAYCSRTCQSEDWSPKRAGQGHKRWCGLQVCEETLDWELVHIMERGVGIRAKRGIPALTRIIVDGFDRSKLGNGVSAENTVTLSDTRRAKYANHSCDANADMLCQLDDKGQEVFILYSRRDILAGEEITINYTTFNDVSRILGRPGRSYLDIHHIKLYSDHRIICPSDCFCRDKEVFEQILKNHELSNALKMVVKTPKEKLKIVMKLLTGLAFVHASPQETTKFLLQAIPLALRLKKPQLAEKYLSQAQLFCANVPHPHAQKALEFQQATNSTTENK